MAPDGAKMVQDEAKMAQDGARMAQDVGQTSPEERRQQNKKKSIHPNSRSSSFAGSILYKIIYNLRELALANERQSEEPAWVCV